MELSLSNEFKNCTNEEVFLINGGGFIDFIYDAAATMGIENAVVDAMIAAGCLNPATCTGIGLAAAALLVYRAYQDFKE